MAENTKISIKEMLSTTVIADNASDETRQYDIKAEVRFERKEVKSISNGRINVTESDVELASFDSWNLTENTLNINFLNGEDRVALIEAVEDFITRAKTLKL